jgi:hypothetical protein
MTLLKAIPAAGVSHAVFEFLLDRYKAQRQAKHQKAQMDAGY